MTEHAMTFKDYRTQINKLNSEKQKLKFLFAQEKETYEMLKHYDNNKLFFLIPIISAKCIIDNDICIEKYNKLKIKLPEYKLIDINKETNQLIFKKSIDDIILKKDRMTLDEINILLKDISLKIKTLQQIFNTLDKQKIVTRKSKEFISKEYIDNLCENSKQKLLIIMPLQDVEIIIKNLTSINEKTELRFAHDVLFHDDLDLIMENYMENKNRFNKLKIISMSTLIHPGNMTSIHHYNIKYQIMDIDIILNDIIYVDVSKNRQPI